MNHLYPRPDRPASPDRPAASTGFAAGRTFPRERPVCRSRFGRSRWIQVVALVRSGEDRSRSTTLPPSPMTRGPPLHQTSGRCVTSLWRARWRCLPPAGSGA